MTKWVDKTLLMDGDAIRRSLIRVAHEIVEKNKGSADLVLVGIRTRGVPLAERLAEEIRRIEATPITVGVLDITLYRDDLSRLGYQPVVRETKIPGNINGKNVILVLTFCTPDGRSGRLWTQSWISAGRRPFNWLY